MRVPCAETGCSPLTFAALTGRPNRGSTAHGLAPQGLYRAACSLGLHTMAKGSTLLEGTVADPGTRVGQGFDIHRYSDDPERTLVLGGVRFEREPGLHGHSDADVVAHACI